MQNLDSMLSTYVVLNFKGIFDCLNCIAMVVWSVNLMPNKRAIIPPRVVVHMYVKLWEIFIVMVPLIGQ